MRQLSQNFLLDEKINNKIVKCCGKIRGHEVCEVGPGPGNITRSIISKGAEKVFLIEKDDRFLPCLQVRFVICFFAPEFKYILIIVFLKLDVARSRSRNRSYYSR